MIAIEVRAPEVAVPGLPATFEVRLFADLEHATTSVRMAVIEDQTFGRLTDEWVHQYSVVSGPARFVGDQRRRYSFVLAPDVAPSHRTGTASVSYRLVVDLALPWRPDIRATGAFTVHPNFAPLPRDTEDHLVTGKRLAIGTRGRRFALGETILGACTVFGSHPPGIEVALVANVQHHLGYERVRVSDIVVPMPSTQFRAGWQLRVPTRIAPTLVARTHRVTWTIVAGDVVLPIELVMPPLQPQATALLAAPPPIDPTPAGGFEHDLVEAQLEIDRRERVISARMRYPRLGLGLELPDGHHARADSFEQAIEAALRPVPGAKLARVTDRELVVEAPLAKIDRTRFAEAMREVAAAITTAIRAIAPRIPDRDHAAWHALAGELGGSYAPADASVIGVLHDASVAIGIGRRGEAEVLVVDLDQGAMHGELPLDASPIEVRRMIEGLHRLRGRSVDPYR